MTTSLEFRQRVLDLVAAGRRVEDIAATWVSATKRCTAGAGKTESTADLTAA